MTARHVFLGITALILGTLIGTGQTLLVMSTQPKSTPLAVPIPTQDVIVVTATPVPTATPSATPTPRYIPVQRTYVPAASNEAKPAL